jgi:hypothetical protein
MIGVRKKGYWLVLIFLTLGSIGLNVGTVVEGAAAGTPVGLNVSTLVGAVLGETVDGPALGASLGMILGTAVGVGEE